MSPPSTTRSGRVSTKSEITTSSAGRLPWMSETIAKRIGRRNHPPKRAQAPRKPRLAADKLPLVAIARAKLRQAAELMQQHGVDRWVVELARQTGNESDALSYLAA